MYLNENIINIFLTIEKWNGKIKLAQFIEDLNLAILQENSSKISKANDGYVKMFKQNVYGRIKTNVTADAFKRMQTKKMIGIQSHYQNYSPEIFYRNKNNKVKKLEVDSEIHQLKINITNPKQDIETDLCADEELTAVISQEIALELDRIVLNFLKKDARTVEYLNLPGSFNPQELFPQKFQEVKETVKEKYNKDLNFMVIPCTWAFALYNHKPSLLGIEFVEEIGGFKVYSDPMCSRSEILLGSSSDDPLAQSAFLTPENIFMYRNVSEDTFSADAKFGLDFVPGGENGFALIEIKM